MSFHHTRHMIILFFKNEQIRRVSISNEQGAPIANIDDVLKAIPVEQVIENITLFKSHIF